MKTLLLTALIITPLLRGEQSILVENRNSRSPAHYLMPNVPPSVQVWIFEADSNADAFEVTIDYSDMQGHESTARMICRDPNRGATVTCTFAGIDALEAEIAVRVIPVVFNRVDRTVLKARTM